MISFDKPISVTSNVTNDPLLVIACTETDVLTIMPTGDFQWVPLASVNADLRFDFRRANWVDISWMSGDDDGSDEEDDRSEGVQGSIPDADGAGDSDQSDEADHGAGDLDSGESENQDHAW